MKKQMFTLIEILFVVTILIILISIGIVAGGKLMRSSADTQIKAEIKMIQAAIEAYKVRWGSYPVSANNKVDFAQYLSKVSPHVEYVTDDNDPRQRKMLIDLKLFNGDNIKNAGYTQSYHGGSIPSVTLRDPYDNVYNYVIIAGLPIVSAKP